MLLIHPFPSPPSHVPLPASPNDHYISLFQSPAPDPVIVTRATLHHFLHVLSAFILSGLQNCILVHYWWSQGTMVLSLSICPLAHPSFQPSLLPLVHSSIHPSICPSIAKSFRIELWLARIIWGPVRDPWPPKSVKITLNSYSPPDTQFIHPNSPSKQSEIYITITILNSCVIL